jgi:transcriptional regulator NrdR family protein
MGSQQCPKCFCNHTNVVDTRKREYGGMQSVYRTRICRSCSHRFRTIETIVAEDQPPQNEDIPTEKLPKTISIHDLFGRKN